MPPCRACVFAYLVCKFIAHKYTERYYTTTNVIMQGFLRFLHKKSEIFLTYGYMKDLNCIMMFYGGERVKREFQITCVICLSIVVMLIAGICVISASNTAVSTGGEFQPLKGVRIVIDPGHGGSDPGSIGVSGTKESLINMKIALYLREFLIISGADVVLTRGDGLRLGEDYGLTKAERIDAIRSAGADMLISIHCNKFSDSAVSGVEVYYGIEDSRSSELAQIISDYMNSVLETKRKRVIRSGENLYVLKADNILSVLVECGYLSNKEEELLLISDEYKKRVAQSIYCGVLRFYSMQ